MIIFVLDLDYKLIFSLIKYILLFNSCKFIYLIHEHQILLLHDGLVIFVSTELINPIV